MIGLISYPATRAETPEKIQWGRSSRLHENDLKIAKNFGTPSKNIGGNEKEGGDPQEKSVSLKSLSRSDTDEKPEQAKVTRCWNPPCKNKQPNGQMPDTLEGGRKIYGRKSRLTDQPRVGPRWQAQYQMMQNI